MALLLIGVPSADITLNPDTATLVLTPGRRC
jgi:hypothetical protein